MLPNTSENSVKVFICSSHAEQDLHQIFMEHLSPLISSGKITIQQDQQIPLGANWEDQTNTHLNEIDLLLPLISANFIASRYCWNEEFQTTIQRHKDGIARVVPILFRPALWENTPLGEIQALPTGLKPITRWSNIHAAFEDAVRGIQIVVEDLYHLLSSQKRELSKQQWLNIGEEHFHAGRFIFALYAYEQVIRLDPNEASAYKKKGHTLNKLRHHNEAISAYEQAIRIDPHEAQTHYGKGLALHGLALYQEALDAFEQALHLDPNNALTYNSKGTTLRKLQRYDEAISIFEQALHLDPNNALTYSSKGTTLINLQRYDEAIFAFKQAIRLDPEYAPAHHYMGIAFSSLQRYNEAVAAFEQALRLRPTYALAYQNMGHALKQLGQQREADLAYEKARQLGHKS